MKHLLLNPEVRPVWKNAAPAKLLAAYEQVWNRKRILRDLYGSWYRQLAVELRPGRIVEVGAGTGNFKRWLREKDLNCVTLDILPGRYVDVQADALRLPFATGTIANIVMIDVLHHFARPFAFISEAARTLTPGGRLLLVEPFVSYWGRFVYRYLHHERVDFGFQESTARKAAWDGNAAIPQLVLQQCDRLPLQVRRVEYCEFLSYPLSGGFSYRSLLPGGMLQALHRLEQNRVFRNRFLSLRVFAVLEKVS